MNNGIVSFCALNTDTQETVELADGSLFKRYCWIDMSPADQFDLPLDEAVIMLLELKKAEKAFRWFIEELICGQINVLECRKAIFLVKNRAKASSAAYDNLVRFERFVIKAQGLGANTISWGEM